jgi:hypothetical protein
MYVYKYIEILWKVKGPQILSQKEPEEMRGYICGEAKIAQTS